MERIYYEIEDRNATMAAIAEAGKIFVADVTINLVNGRLTTCYYDVEDAPPPPETEIEQEDMLAALTILGVEPEEG